MAGLGTLICGTRLVVAVLLTTLSMVSTGGGASAAAGAVGTTTRASVASSGSEGNHLSLKPTVSADGRYVAFGSSATNLVPGDTNEEDDIFVHDRESLVTTRVSVGSDGAQGDTAAGVRRTYDPAISPDGRYVAFVSTMRLVPDDSIGSADLFVHDRVTHATSLAVNVDFEFAVSPVFSADSLHLAFSSESNRLVEGDTNNTSDVFVHHLGTGVTTRVSVPDPDDLPPPLADTEANGASTNPSISGDGRYVAFASEATNLLGLGGDSNGAADVFVRDRVAGTTIRVSRAADGGETNGAARTPSMSTDGRFVAFSSSASNLVPSDTNASSDVFVRDRDDDTNTRVSVATGGAQVTGWSDSASISGDGTHVVFASTASDLVAGDTNADSDVFVHDRAGATTTRVSSASDGTEANDSSSRPSISGEGRYAAFDSHASNLVPGDSNGFQDVFVHDTEGATLAPALWVGDASVDEGDGGTRNMTFNLRLDRPSDSVVSVAFSTADRTAVAPGDYQAASGTVSFAPGTSTHSVEVTVNGDTEPEEDESFTLTISAASGATISRGTASGTILNDEAVLAIGDVKVHEGDTRTRGAVFTVSLSEPAPTAVAVSYSTSNDTALKSNDYTRQSGTLELPAGATSARIKVPVVGDTADESDETFTVTLANAEGATIADAVGTGTIMDDDPPSLSGRRIAIGDAAVHGGDEGTRVAVFTVSLSKPATSAISVDYHTSDFGATASGDYLEKTGTATVAAGATSTAIKITIVGDRLDETNEIFFVGISNPNGDAVTADYTGRGTILDDD